MRAVVFANGSIPKIDLVAQLITNEDLIASADGGLRYIRMLNLMPNLVIGDLDSVSKDDIEFLNNNNIEIMKFPVEKDQTDLEIALRELIGRGCNDILVIGALGGRIDQTLANIGLLSLLSGEDTYIELDDGRERIMLIRDHLTLIGKKGDTVSLIPLCAPAVGVTTKGLSYSLADEQLYPEQTRGISNMMIGGTAEIQIASGIILCVHTRGKVE